MTERCFSWKLWSGSHRLLWVLTLGGVFGFDQALLHQSPVELLEVRVHALPVRLPHPHHILHIQKLRTVCQLPTLTPRWGTEEGKKTEKGQKQVGYTKPVRREKWDTQDKIKKPTLNTVMTAYVTVFSCLTFRTNICAKTNNIKKSNNASILWSHYANVAVNNNIQ